MNVELVAQMFKNYQSNVLFHLEGNIRDKTWRASRTFLTACSYGQPQGPYVRMCFEARLAYFVMIDDRVLRRKVPRWEFVSVLH